MAALSDSSGTLRLYHTIADAGFQAMDASDLDTMAGIVGGLHHEDSFGKMNDRIHNIFESYRSTFYREDGTVAQGEETVARLHRMESKLRSFYNMNQDVIQEMGRYALNNRHEAMRDFKALAQMNGVDQRIVSLALFFVEQESFDLAVNLGAVAQPLLVLEEGAPDSNMLLELYHAVVHYKHWQGKDRLKEQLAESIHQDPSSLEARIKTIEARVNAITSILMESAKPRKERALYQEKNELCARWQVLVSMQKELKGFATTNHDLIRKVGADVVNNPGRFRKDASKLREMDGANQPAITLIEFFAGESADLLVSQSLPDVDLTPAQQRDIAIAQAVSVRRQSGSSSQSLQWNMMPQTDRRQFMPIEFLAESPDAMWEEDESPMWDEDSPPASPPVPPHQGPALRDNTHVIQMVIDKKPKPANDLDI